jgi:peptidoglycan/xylan/chitin deacetylase (PgdA/CDA1 family)
MRVLRWALASALIGAWFSTFTASEVTAQPGDTRPVIYLTFDDGPASDESTTEVLGLLTRYRVTATFFVVGASAGRYPDTVRAISRAGHTVANHTWSHPDLTTRSNAEVAREFATTQEVLRDLVGYAPACWRPPYGRTDSRVRTLAATQGLAEWKWSINAEDYKATTSRIRQLLDTIRGGDVVLLHDGPRARTNSRDALASWLADNAHRFRFEALPGCRPAAAFAVPPFANVDDLIDRQYRDLLGRTADAQGQRYHSALLRGYGVLSRDAFTASLVGSPEFAGRMAPVLRLYQAAFNRPPDVDGLQYWARSGASMPAIAEQFASSAEFQLRYGALDDAGFVRRLYLNVLGREPDPTGASYWQGGLSAGLSRGAVLLGFSESRELISATTHRNQAIMLYAGLLGRDPDPGGLTYWESVLRAGTSFTGAIGSFLDSPEYRNRLDRLGHRTVR